MILNYLGPLALVYNLYRILEKYSLAEMALNLLVISSVTKFQLKVFINE